MGLLEKVFPSSASPGPEDLSADDERRQQDVRQLNVVLVPLLVLAFLAALLKGYQSNAVAAVVIWAVACTSAGGTAGFLFGIPRSGFNKVARAEPADANGNGQSGTPLANGITPNTNLEEVSDWLTKIIVGLTLVNLDKIQGEVAGISLNMAASFHPVPNTVHTSFATALVVGFFILGFLCGYLYTRLILQGAFERSNQSVIKQLRYQRVVEKELSAADAAFATESVPEAGDPGPVLSASEQKSAERVYRATTPNQLEEVMKEIRILAQEYERVRSSLPAGGERTRAMSQVVKRMTVFGLAAQPLLPRLVSSDSAGERLAASVILRMQFNPNYIEWLGKQLKSELPFPVFHALQALRAGMTQASDSDKKRIRDVVRAAKPGVESASGADSSRLRLMEQILADDS